MILFKIILLGYMGSGKSAVGAQLAKALNCSFVDLDRFIEENEGRSVPKIFEIDGELYFRKKERKYLEVLLNKTEPIVISLGGGTPCYYDTMNYILNSKDTKSFYLNTGINSLVSRLKSESTTRPLLAHLKDTEAIKEFIGKHLFERNPFYQKAQYQITTDLKSIESIVKEIQEKLS